MRPRLAARTDVLAVSRAPDSPHMTPEIDKSLLDGMP